MLSHVVSEANCCWADETVAFILCWRHWSGSDQQVSLAWWTPSSGAGCHQPSLGPKAQPRARRLQRHRTMAPPPRAKKGGLLGQQASITRRSACPKVTVCKTSKFTQANHKRNPSTQPRLKRSMFCSVDQPHPLNDPSSDLRHSEISPHALAANIHLC